MIMTEVKDYTYIDNITFSASLDMSPQDDKEKKFYWKLHQ